MGPILAASLACAQAPTPAGDRLEAQVREQADTVLGGLVREGRSSFGSAIFVRDGRVKFTTTYGQEAPDTNIPFSIDSTLIDLNSINKVFTAISIAQLVANGSIASIDDPVNRYLKHFKLPPAYGHEITIRAVATHSAGLDLAAFGAGPLESQPAQFFQQRFPGYFENAGRYSTYENFGPKLLAYMVSEVSGRPLSSYIEDSILRPLGMNHTFLVATPTPLQHRLVSFQTRAPANTAMGPPLKSADTALLGGVSVSTMSDMARLITALVGPDEGQTAITQPMRDLMFQILQSNGAGGSAHGLIFDALRSGPHTIFTHGGIGPGIDCMLAMDMTRHASIFFCYGDVRARIGNNPAFSPPIYQQVTDDMLTPFTACYPDDHEKCTQYPAPRWNDAWKPYLGLYIDLARHHHGFSRLRTLLHANTLRVERSGDTLRLGDQDGFVEISPGTFGSPNHTETFSFINDAATGSLRLSTSDRPSVYKHPEILDNPYVLPNVFALLVLIAVSGGLVLLPAYALETRVRVAAGAYGFIIGVGVAVIFGLRAFGARYFEGVSWPLDIVRVCAFLTIPACALLLYTTLRARPTPVRLARLHLIVLCISSVLMVAALLAVDLISFGRIT
jgi:CubicO group peptidase (beta-lactamase class C family)